MSEELTCWYCGNTIKNPNNIFKIDIEETHEVQYWHKKCAEEQGMTEVNSGDENSIDDKDSYSGIGISENTAIQCLGFFAWVDLIAGIIVAIVIWSTMSTDSLGNTNTFGIILGFVSLISGIFGWALFLVICSIANSLISIKDTWKAK